MRSLQCNPFNALYRLYTMSILTISGSPSPTSRSNRLLGYLREELIAHGLVANHLDLRSLPAEALLYAQTDHPAIVAAVAQLEQATTVIVATPVYKAAYSGLLKVFLDLLPQSGLRDKTVLPLATGGSLAHALIIDYALRPVLASLGPAHILPGIFAIDQHIVWEEVAGLQLDPALIARLQDGVGRVRHAHGLRAINVTSGDVQGGVPTPRATLGSLLNATAVLAPMRCKS
jgi:FMN reductase